MVHLLATKRRAGTQAILTDNATNQQRFINLKSVFAQNDLYRLFAEPAESTTEISWYTDWPVDPDKPLLTLGELSVQDPNHAQEVKGKVASLMDAFYREAEKYRSNGQSYERLRHILTDSFEIPEGDSNVWILTDTSGQERYVLTQWGYLRDEYNPRRGLINSWERVSRKNITIKATWNDNAQPASGQTLTFTDSEGNRIGQFTTDADGQGVLANVLPNVPVSYQQNRLDGLSINQGQFVIDDQAVTYDLSLIRVGDLTIHTKPGTTVTVAYDNTYETYTADANGGIHLPNLRGGTAIRAFQNADGQEHNEKLFRFDPDSPAVSFTVPDVVVKAALPPPLPNDIRVELHGRKQLDAPLAAADITFQLAGRTERRRTDERGVCSLNAVPPGSISVQALHRGKTYAGTFLRTPAEDYYRLWVQPRRSLAWLWWLLGILLLLALLCYWHLLPVCPYCCEEPQPRVIRTEPITGDSTINVGDKILHRGDITLTLEWHTSDDLDLLLKTPDGKSIDYSDNNREYRSSSNDMTGYLEVDANVNPDSIERHPIEHIYCKKPISGQYQVYVNFWKARTGNSEVLPFTVRVQVGDSISVFNGNRSTFTGVGRGAEPIVIKEFTYP